MTTKSTPSSLDRALQIRWKPKIIRLGGPLLQTNRCPPTHTSSLMSWNESTRTSWPLEAAIMELALIVESQGAAQASHNVRVRWRPLARTRCRSSTCSGHGKRGTPCRCRRRPVRSHVVMFKTGFRTFWIIPRNSLITQRISQIDVLPEPAPPIADVGFHGPNHQIHAHRASSRVTRRMKSS